MATTRRRALMMAFGLGAAVAIEGPQKLLDALAGIELEPRSTVADQGWLSDELHPRYTEAVADRGETITVMRGSGAYFRAGDILRCEQTGENMAVTAVDHDTISVVRALGANLQQTVQPRNGIVRIGQAYWDAA